MAQVGLHAYIALRLKEKTPKKKWFLFSFILGSIIPDLDKVFTFFFFAFLPFQKSYDLTYRTFTHSIFTFTVVYLIFLIIYELTKKQKFLTIGNALISGFLLHIFIDIFFWFDSIHIFWPLPIEKLNLWTYFNFNNTWFINTIILLEFVFFRLFLHKMIDIIISFPSQNGKYLNQIILLSKTQLYFIAILLICMYFNKYNIIKYLFYIMYIPSITLIIYYLNIVKDSFNEYSLYKKDLKVKEFSKKSPIRNIE